jgi:predicted RNA-binding Zn ribbon-like protein
VVSSSRSRSVLRFGDGGWAELVGNHLVLDLVNTVAWRLDQDRLADRLPDGLAVIRWARFAGLLDDQEAADFSVVVTADSGIGHVVAQKVRTLREQLYRVLHPLTVGDEPESSDVEGLRRLFVDAWAQAQIASVMPLRWSTASRTVLDLPVELTLAAGRLLEGEDPARLRQCRDEACGWLFLDRSKNGSRVWCSSADCGNRTRARRHHQRQTSARPRGSESKVIPGRRPRVSEPGGGR